MYKIIGHLLYTSEPSNLRPRSLSCFKQYCRDFYKNKISGFDPDHPHVAWVKIIVQFSVMINSLCMLLCLTTSFSFFFFSYSTLSIGYGKVISKSLRRQYFITADIFYKAAHLKGYTFAKEGYISVLKVKIKFRSNFFKPGLIL